MKIGAPKETFDGEKRVAMTPQSARGAEEARLRLPDRGGRRRRRPASPTTPTPRRASRSCRRAADALGAGRHRRQGPRRRPPRRSSWPAPGQIADQLRLPGAERRAAARALKAKGATAIAMDMVPRISRAQKMDALSLDGEHRRLPRGDRGRQQLRPLLHRPGHRRRQGAARQGAGDRRRRRRPRRRSAPRVGLGAIVRAFDVRPEVAEQIEIMGAEFLILDFAETQDGAATGGYAAPSSPEFREKQLELFREQAPEVDIVITTALIPGRPAPKLWPKDMVEAMKPGSVVVDLAAEQGGNCDLTKPGKMFETKNGVTDRRLHRLRRAGWRPRPRRSTATTSATCWTT